MSPLHTPKAVLLWMAAAWTANAEERQQNPWKAEAVGWPTLFVLDPKTRTMVTRLAWAVAHDEKISELVRESGWSRSTFDRKTNAGLQVIADGLNAREARRSRDET